MFRGFRAEPSRPSLPPPPPPSPTFRDRWRNIRWRDNQEDLQALQNYQPEKDGVTRLRVLLFGPVGSGKSSFINSIMTVMRGQISIKALVSAANTNKSFTKKFNIYKIQKGRGHKRTHYPIVFCDIMGLEEESGHGVHAEDIKLVLKGHVKENYRFNPVSPLSSDKKDYNPNPSLDDRVHILVSILSANMPDIGDSYLQKMADIREAATDVYRSKHLKKKMKDFSATTGIPMNCIFPVKNYSEEIEVDEDVDTLILKALRLMVQFGDDFIEEI